MHSVCRTRLATMPLLHPPTRLLIRNFGTLTSKQHRAPPTNLVPAISLHRTASFSTSSSFLDAEAVTVKGEQEARADGGKSKQEKRKDGRPRKPQRDFALVKGKKRLSNPFVPVPSWELAKDPNWKHLSARKRQQVRVANNYRDPTMWEENRVPHAVLTSNFDYKTIRAVQRFPSLGKYAQKSSTPRKYMQLRHVRYNDCLNRPEVYYTLPSTKHLMRQLHKREIAIRRKQIKEKGLDVDWTVRGGDEIELCLYSNLHKEKSTRTRCLVIERRRRGFGSSIIVRNTERDGLRIFRQFPLYSPWIKSLKVVKRYKVKRRRIKYMYDAPARVSDPVVFGKKIGVRTRTEFYKWLKNTREGTEFRRRQLLKRRMLIHGARQGQRWMVKLGRLHFRLPVMNGFNKGWFRMQKRKRNVKKWDLKWYHKWNGVPYPLNN